MAAPHPPLTCAPLLPNHSLCDLIVIEWTPETLESAAELLSDQPTAEGRPRVSLSPEQVRLYRDPVREGSEKVLRRRLGMDVARPRPLYRSLSPELVAELESAPDSDEGEYYLVRSQWGTFLDLAVRRANEPDTWVSSLDVTLSDLEALKLFAAEPGQECGILARIEELDPTLLAEIVRDGVSRTGGPAHPVRLDRDTLAMLLASPHDLVRQAAFFATSGGRHRPEQTPMRTTRL